MIPKKDKPIIHIIALQINKSSHKELSKIAYDTAKDLAARELGLSKDDIKIVRTPFGKPYIVGYEQWHFSITHTSGMIGLAISDEPVGIDAEKIRDADLRIAKRFFTDQENFRMENSENKDRCFFEIWTKKEAYLKYTGKGLRTPLKSFDVFELAQKFESFEEDGYMYSVCHERINDIEMSIERCDLTQ